MNIKEVVSLAPVIPVITLEEVAHAVPLARALVAGGLRVLEVTLRTPAAFACIDAMRKSVPEAVVGVGTLTKPADFAGADRVGAQFGVTPGLTSELAAAARGARFPLLPGAMTPSEVIAARHLGFKVLKLFPADIAGGVRMLKALAPLFPDVEFCPTGGVSRESAPDYLALPNVVCVGGSWITPPNLLAAGDWAEIEKLAREAAALKG
jgi:2-dehydro-3-deoxyphosphogluconate aldolase/(4S)-4-hydroxy-2-oxoglutarate aldolase